MKRGRKPGKYSVRLARKPLMHRIRGGVLTIEIGIDTLAWACLRSQYAYDLLGEDYPRLEPAKAFRIDDKQEFADDVLREMLDEAEDGSNLLNMMLDEACKRAIEQGSIAFVDTRDEHPTSHPERGR